MEDATQTRSKVVSARRRIVLGHFGQTLCVTLFAALIISTIAIAIPAIRVMELDFGVWVQSWLIGSTVIAVLTAAIYAIATAPSISQVAAEVDHRFGLKERLSSSLSITPDDRDSAFGLALAADAEARASKVKIAERFGLRPSRLTWLPLSLVPVIAVMLMLVEPAADSSASVVPSVDSAESDQVQAVARSLKKTLQRQKRKAVAKGLEDAADMFDKMESELDKISKRSDLSRKEALIAINDLKKQLEERRAQLGSSDQMRKMMNQLNGFENGPAEKVAKSISKGEFGKAQEVVNELAKKMRDGELTEQEKKALAKQVKQMKEQMQQAAKQHQQKKQELQQKIDQAKREGRMADAAKMQQQMNQMKQQDGNMQRMQQMAEALGQAQQAMQQGNSSEAADALEQMAEQLGDMQSELDELEDLQDAMDQLSQSKNQMRCQGCNGAGCQSCQGMGMDGFGMGNGLGKGSGAGDRPENEEDTNTYETQVRGQVKNGKAIIAGYADGPNRKGITREDIKQAIESSLAEEGDPLENQNLPRTEREHAQQYFDRLREGE